MINDILEHPVSAVSAYDPPRYPRPAERVKQVREEAVAAVRAALSDPDSWAVQKAAVRAVIRAAADRTTPVEIARDLGVSPLHVLPWVTCPRDRVALLRTVERDAAQELERARRLLGPLAAQPHTS